MLCAISVARTFKAIWHPLDQAYVMHMLALGNSAISEVVLRCCCSYSGQLEGSRVEQCSSLLCYTAQTEPKHFLLQECGAWGSAGSPATAQQGYMLLMQCMQTVGLHLCMINAGYAACANILQAVNVVDMFFACLV